MKLFLFNFRTFNTRVWCWGCLLPTVFLLACSNNDLSDLNDLAENVLQGTSYVVELDINLAAAQVVSKTPVTNSVEATGRFSFDLGTASVSGEVVIKKQEAEIDSVFLGRGFAGQKGVAVAQFAATDDSSAWRLPENFMLSDSDSELLLRGGLYVQVATVNNTEGDVRAQLIIGDQEVMVNPITSDQVIDAGVDSSAKGTSYITINRTSGEVQGSVWLTGEIQPQRVIIRQGIAGKTGDIIITCQEDSAVSGVWHIPNQVVKNTQLVEAFTSASTYVEVTSEQYPDGELRGQVYPEYFLVSISELSGLNLVPQIMTQARGRAYFTLNGIDGNVQAILHTQDMIANDAAIFRISNINNFDNRKLLLPMEQQDDYWRLPSGSSFENRDFASLGNKQIFLIVTSPDFELGEIGGWL
jgi:hypothetical protein